MSFWHDPDETLDNTSVRLRKASSLTDLESIAEKITGGEVDGQSNSADVDHMGERISNILHRTFFTEQEKLLRGEPVDHPVLNADIRREGSHTFVTGELSGADQSDKTWNEYFDKMMTQLTDEEGQVVGSPPMLSPLTLSKNGLPEFGKELVVAGSDVERSAKGGKLFSSVEWATSSTDTNEFFRNYEDVASDSEPNDDFDHPKKSVLISMSAKPFLGDDSSQHQGAHFSGDMFGSDSGGRSMKRVSSLSQIDKHNSHHSGPCLLPMPTAAASDLHSLFASIPRHAWILPYVVVGAILLSDQRKNSTRSQKVGGKVSFMASFMDSTQRSDLPIATATALFPRHEHATAKTRDDIGMHTSPRKGKTTPHEKMWAVPGTRARPDLTASEGIIDSNSAHAAIGSPGRSNHGVDVASGTPGSLGGDSASTCKQGHSRFWGKKRGEASSSLDDSHYRDKETSGDIQEIGSDNSGRQRRFHFGRSMSKQEEDASMDDSHFRDKDGSGMSKSYASENDLANAAMQPPGPASVGSPPVGLLSGLISRMRHNEDQMIREEVEASVHGDLVMSHDEHGVYLTSKPERFNSDSALHSLREDSSARRETGSVANETSALPKFMQHLFVFPNFVTIGSVYICKTNPAWGEWEKRRIFLWDNFVFEASPENEGIPIGFANVSGAILSMKSEFSMKGESDMYCDSS
jgi:hypothetical protein